MDLSLVATLRYLQRTGVWLLGGDAPPPGRDSLEDIRRELGDCRRCRLWESRTRIVFGVGSARAELVFVGEAPGFHEDIQGEPFVGRAGQLLDRMIAAIGLSRDRVYIANVLKCRPPDNRDPAPDEVAACIPFLWRQIEAIGPRVICALGAHAARSLLGVESPITALRGRPHRVGRWTVVPTYHPAFLLRNPRFKRQAWSDLKTLERLLRGPTGPAG